MMCSGGVDERGGGVCVQGGWVNRWEEGQGLMSGLQVHLKDRPGLILSFVFPGTPV